MPNTAGGRLFGSWGSGDPQEHSIDDQEGGALAGAEASDDEQARAAIGWIADQLRRTVERRTWRRLGGEFHQFVLADSGFEVSRLGPRWRSGARRNPPSEVHTVPLNVIE